MKLPRTPRSHAVLALGIIATSALMIVGPSSTAATASRLIGSAGILNGSIRSIDIRDETVTGRDVKDGSLTARDFSGALGGAPGPTGPAGADGTGRWVLVDGDGTIAAQSGGFSVSSAYDAPGAPLGAVGNVYIDANEDLSDNAVVAALAMQNQSDHNADGITNGRSLNPDSNPEWSGEVTASVCAIPGIIACSPTGTNDREHFVVSPRLSDGQVTRSTDRKRFYVVISGDSSDVTADAAAIPATAVPTP